MSDLDDLTIDWEDDLLADEEAKTAAAAAAAPAPPKLSPEEAMKAFKEAKRAAPARKPEPTVIAAPTPVPLHTVKFPVYDRKDGGFRIIERAFGTPELKTFIKVALDAILSTDPNAAVEPVHNLDASRHLTHPVPPVRLHPERLTAAWRCRHQGANHDPRSIIAAGAGTPASAAHLIDFMAGIDNCVAEQHYNRGTNIRSVVREGSKAPSGFGRYNAESVHSTPDAWAFYEDHAPFLAFDLAANSWQSLIPPEWQDPPPLSRDQTLSTWEFPNNSF